eukprot:3170494-Alexandrium_andersonii.AAC.1
MKEEVDKNGMQALLSNCRFGPADLDTMAAAWDSPGLQGALLDAARTRAMQVPEAPGLADKAVLESFRVHDFGAREHGTLPAWAQTVCRHREHFQQCGLVGLARG